VCQKHISLLSILLTDKVAYILYHINCLSVHSTVHFNHILKTLETIMNVHKKL